MKKQLDVLEKEIHILKEMKKLKQFCSSVLLPMVLRLTILIWT